MDGIARAPFWGMQDVLRYIYNAISGDGGQSVVAEGFDRLISEANHSALLRRRRARVILSRVRMLSLLCLVAFPIGFLPDFLAFDTETLITIGVSRALIAVMFLSLFFGIGSGETIRDAYRALAIFFAILLTFQGMSQPLLNLTDLSAISGITSAGYVLFPFFIVVCIGIFPLTVKEAFLTMVLFSLAEILILIMLPEQGNPFQHLGILLSLMAVGILCTVSAISQLRYMASLVDQASIDTLTNCYTRNSGEEIIDVQFKIAKREDSPLSVAFVDLDDFKSINDKFGHEAGDKVLAAAAAHLKRNGRGSDVIIRWGGEEFVILLPNTDAEGALKSIRRLRNTGLGKRPNGTFLTASYGIAEMKSADVNDWQTLVELADDQMYLVKSQGGNDIALLPATQSETTPPEAEEIA
ncbi:MAG: GGDEF domain-containing protein [Sneathiella sp.]|nr:MAG: GGDEF domain-containing protein [Sneathiella sp.]